MKMPASTSTVELAGAALKSSLSKNNNNDNNYLDGHILASTKKSLLNDFEFESSENHQLTVLDALKTKYILLKAPEISQNGQKKTEQKERTTASPNNKSDEEIQCVQKIQTELFPMEKIQLGWSHRKDWSVGAGMVNMGNTCYLNSTLQALFHVPSLVNWLISDKEHTAHCENSGVCIICAMRKTLEESQQRNITSIRPILIFNKLRSVYRNLIPGRQEDAHEFLRYLVEAMEKAYLQRFKNSTQFESKVKETTPLNQILGGYLRSAVRCLKCGHISTTFQHFQDLPLDIRKAQTIDEALELYFSRENLDDESYLCESCHRKVPATKQFQMERAPMVLCIQLKRFSVSNNKISKNIIFRQRLDLSRYASRKPKIALNYRLVALITHMGLTVNCGHYTAVAQSPAGGYYQFDDSMVRQVSHQSVFNTNAYIMFYELENSAHIPKFLPSLNLNKAAAKPSSTITEPAADAAASSTTTTKILLPVSSSSSSSSTKKINNKIPTTSTTEIVLPVNSAKSLPPLGVGFTSDKVYGPELPPERLNVTSSSSSSFTMNGKSKATTTSLKLTDDDDESSTECSAEEEEEDESSVKVKNSPSVTDATTTKEADSSTTSNEETLLLLASSSDNSPNNNNCSVVSTSNNTNNNNNSSRDNNKNNSSNKKKISVSSSPSKSLVPYETGDTSGSEDSNHSDNNKVATKVTMGGDWQVTSSTDVTTSSSSSDKNNNKKNQRGVSNNISGGNSSNNNKVINELFKLSTAGYSAPVSTWNGTRSQLDKEINQEKREDRKRSLADSSSEDAPRAKRAKINSSLFKTKSNPGYNPVQEFHNMKNSWNNNNNNNGSSSSSSSSGSGNNNQNYHHKPFYKHRRNNFNNHRGTNSRGNFHRNISRFR